jgi:phage regulator Rha-like protein
MLTGKEYRNIAERFQHSTSTVSRSIHEVLDIMDDNISEFMIPFSQETPSRITNDRRYQKYFKNCIGALDGTHVHAVVYGDAAEQKKFRNRKGWISQNVLGVCNFDLTFSYVLAGWSGAAHDAKVLQDAWTKGLECPDGKYYIADAGYGLSEHILVPFRGTRYHLNDWRDRHRAPENAHEIFNKRHSQLRNCIERAFGVVKARFSILKLMHPFPFPVQVSIVQSCFALHNFIRKNMTYEDDYFRMEIPVEDDEEDDDVDEIDRTVRANEQCETWRDNIANTMWQDNLH